MKTIIRFALAAIVMLSVTFMSANHVWAANPAQTTGGTGSTHVASDSGLWFADFPNGSLPEGSTVNITEDFNAFDLPTYPDTGHRLHGLNTTILSISPPGDVGFHLVCFKTLPSGGAIFWFEPVLLVWVPMANFQTYPLFDGMEYTCVNTTYTGTFVYAYVVP